MQLSKEPSWNKNFSCLNIDSITRNVQTFWKKSWRFLYVNIFCHWIFVVNFAIFSKFTTNQLFEKVQDRTSLLDSQFTDLKLRFSNEVFFSSKIKLKRGDQGSSFVLPWNLSWSFYFWTTSFDRSDVFWERVFSILM